MIVSKQKVLAALPPFQDKRVDIVDRQQVKDIISTMIEAHKRNAWLYDRIGSFFIGATIDETCDNLYNFCYQNLKYDQEPDNLQTIAVPQGLLTIGHCDCKGFASFICGCLDAIKRSGKQNVGFEYCFASYDLLKKTPYHVFAVAKTPGGVPIWVDPTPGAEGKIPVWQICKTVKTSGMLQDIVAGVDGGYPAVGRYQGKQPELRSEQSDKAAAALAGLGYVSRAPQISQTLFPAQEPAAPTPVNRVHIGDVTTPTGTEPSLIQGISNKNLFIGVGTIAAVYMLTHPRMKIIGAVKKGKVMPLVLLAGAGIAAYYFYKKSSNPFGDDPEIKDLVRTPGRIQLSPTQYAAKAARSQTWVNPVGGWYENIYRDVLDWEIPVYKSAIDSMTMDEQVALYHFVQDTGPEGLDANDPAYTLLVQMRDKYKLPFY